MFSKQVILLLTLAVASIAVPTAKADAKSLVGRAEKIPDKVQAPKEGQCGLLVYSATILPLGGTPTTTEGEGIAPSEEGEPSAAVINHNKDIIGPAVALKPQSPGFAADIKLDNDMGTVSMTAGTIMPGKQSWYIEYDYKGKHYKARGDPTCEQYNLSTTGLDSYSIHSCYFPC